MLLQGPCLTREKPLSGESVSVSTIQSQYQPHTKREPEQNRKGEKTDRKEQKTDRETEQQRNGWKGKSDSKLPRRLEFC